LRNAIERSHWHFIFLELMIHYTRVTSDNELYQILAIQTRALKGNVSLEEQQLEGYITVPHTFDQLKAMNDITPHILAKDSDRVAGYALVMPRSFKTLMPVLTPMFDTADRLLAGKNYLTMGQICIDKPYRGQGIFRGLYAYYKAQMSNSYDCLFTEVATSNIRSLKAHESVGFKILETQTSDGTTWEMINWDWNH